MEKWRGQFQADLVIYSINILRSSTISSLVATLAVALQDFLLLRVGIL